MKTQQKIDVAKFIYRSKTMGIRHGFCREMGPWESTVFFAMKRSALDVAA